MKIKDLKPDKIYSGNIKNGGKIIFIPNKCELYNNNYDVPNEFQLNNCPDQVENIELAIFPECQWLQTCLKANKFISKEEALKSEVKFKVGKMEEFVLPEEWYIKVTDENKSVINNWKINQKYNNNLYDYNYIYVQHDGAGQAGGWKEPGWEITFDQFKQYVMKEDDEFKSGDYITCLSNFDNCKCNGHSKGGVGYVANKTFKISSIDKNSIIWLDPSTGYGICSKVVRRATKEEIDSVIKKQPIEKWSVGSWVVALKNISVCIASFNVGSVAEIKREGKIYFNRINWSCTQKSEDNGNVKWFATKQEAEEFSKSLLGIGIIKQIQDCDFEYDILFMDKIQEATASTQKLDKPKNEVFDFGIKVKPIQSVTFKTKSINPMQFKEQVLSNDVKFSKVKLIINN